VEETVRAGECDLDVFMALFGGGYAKTSCAETPLRPTVLRQNGRAKTAAPNCPASVKIS